jgi:hypothetical protein
VSRVEELLEILHRPIRRVDPVEVGDVVAVVAERRGIHRQNPETVDAQLLDVVEPLDEPREVADAVAVAVHERLDVDLVEHRVLVPVARGRSRHHQRSTR